ncbi:MAG: zinc ribbon domain-containing protein [Oscillospiraceae bacterium]|nr:zinc ribbon domain-containing protein [Oscillospiraceae bacterium]
MKTCPQCGTQNPDHYTHCPNCGAQYPAQQPMTQPMQPPLQQPMPQTNGYIPPAYQQPQDQVTSVGAWFGWSLLIGMLPLIGSIIMLCCVKDPSAKNYAKLIVVLQVIVTIFYVLMFLLGIAGGMSASRSF